MLGHRLRIREENVNLATFCILKFDFGDLLLFGLLFKILLATLGEFYVYILSSARPTASLLFAASQPFSSGKTR